jgi:hypothetical protein
MWRNSSHRNNQDPPLITYFAVPATAPVLGLEDISDRFTIHGNVGHSPVSGSSNLAPFTATLAFGARKDFEGLDLKLSAHGAVAGHRQSSDQVKFNKQNTRSPTHYVAAKS